MTITGLVDFLGRFVASNPHMADCPIHAQSGGEIHGLGVGGGHVVLTADYRPETAETCKWEFFESIFILGGVTVLWHVEIANQYWPSSYMKRRAEEPWWLVFTPLGPIQIGWRKRVISISWEHAAIRKIVTEDETTKGDDHVHAWTAQKAVEYLRSLAGHPEKVTK